MSEFVYSAPPLDWEHWLALYRPHIRTSVDWDALVADPPRTRQITVVDKERALYAPWFDGGWRSGKKPYRMPRQHLTACAVRAPGVLLPDGAILLLDGNHRVQGLRPRLVVADCLIPRGKQWRAFNDLHSDFLRPS